MEYKVVPFVATINQQKEQTSVVASQLEAVIENYANQGWDYVRLESVSTYVQPIHTGCFGKTEPGYMSSYQMVVFSRK
ncbi:hypothetical protein [Pedobacter sp. ASV28]|jgi:hypothetical protein|uniref:hypothetical protein n=1 Tax=Pedobacter sp. ASV28 TaxID=2795123 RepID=UPI0018EAC68A|nr:hypothetical protein [Pedobacter sp. ASV28]